MFNKTILIFIIWLISSCSNNKHDSRTKNHQNSLSKASIDRELYFDFLLNLERSLWGINTFVKTDYNNGSGWQLIDKNGKYIIKSNKNFTEYSDTSIYDYELTIIEIDNELTNKKKTNQLVDIKFKMKDGRTVSIPLEFTYQPKKSSKYIESIHRFRYEKGIIVDYSSCMNSEYSITWERDSIIRTDLDCNENSFYKKQILWKKH